MMSRKHFEALARVLHAHRGDYYMSVKEFLQLCNEIANVCAVDNPAFNRAMFLNACVTGNKHKDYRK